MAELNADQKKKLKKVLEDISEEDENAYNGLVEKIGEQNALLKQLLDKPQDTKSIEKGLSAIVESIKSSSESLPSGLAELKKSLDGFYKETRTAFDGMKTMAQPADSVKLLNQVVLGLSGVETGIKAWRWPQYMQVGLRDKNFANINPATEDGNLSTINAQIAKFSFTGNKLQVDAVLDASEIDIGQVNLVDTNDTEINPATSDNQTNGNQKTQVTNFPANQPVSGTVTANQGTANTNANAWPTQITDGVNSTGILVPGTANSSANALPTAGTTLTVPFTTTSVQAVGSTDAGNYAWVSVQINTQGTGSTVTFQVSNDNSKWDGQDLEITSSSTTAAVGSTTTAATYHGPAMGRYFRLNVTGISAGTTAGNIVFSTVPKQTIGIPSTIVTPATGTVATLSIVASNSTVTTGSSSGNGVAFVTIHGTYAGITFGITLSDDAGTTFYPVPQVYDITNSAWVSGASISPSSNASQMWAVPLAGLSTAQLKILSSAYTSGTGLVRVVFSAAPYAFPPTPIPTGTNSIGQVTAIIPGVISTLNATTTPLGISGVYTGGWEDVSNYANISVLLKTDQNSATSGAQIQFSNDGSTVVRTLASSITGTSNGYYFSLIPEGRYFRLVYTNGTVGQTTFIVQTTFGYVPDGLSQAPIASTALNDQSAAALVRAIEVGKTPSATYVNKASMGVSVSNNTTTPLAGNATFTGAYETCTGFVSLAVTVKSDVASGASGILIDFSDDGSTLRRRVSKDFSSTDVSNGSKFFTVPVAASYFRISYTNGAVAQSSFFLQSILSPIALEVSRDGLEAGIDSSNVGTIVRGVAMAKNDAGVYGNITRGNSGGVRVSINEFEASAPIKALTTFVTQQVSVGTSATAIVNTGTAGRKSIAVKNLSTSTGPIFIGPTNAVTTGNGYELAAGESVVLEIDATTGVYGISPSGSRTVSYIEVS